MFHLFRAGLGFTWSWFRGDVGYIFSGYLSLSFFFLMQVLFDEGVLVLGFKTLVGVDAMAGVVHVVCPRPELGRVTENLQKQGQDKQRAGYVSVP